MPNNQPTIDLATSGNFQLTFVSEISGKAHSVEIPNSEKGLACLRNILMARQREETKIGQTGNPTQEMIRAWLNNKNEQDALTKRQEEEEKHEQMVNFF